MCVIDIYMVRGIIIRKLELCKCKFYSTRDRGNTGTNPAAVCSMAGNGRSYCELLNNLFYIPVIH